MKKKTKKVVDFLDSMHSFIVRSPQFRKEVSNKTETQMQTEIRPIIVNFLTHYFRKVGYKNPRLLANKSFYWEGQEGSSGIKKKVTFGARHYPDFIIKKPYLIGVEYKKSASGAVVKQGIGQSIMHTLSEEFDFVYFLFHDQNKDKRIKKSIRNKKEKYIIDLIWNRFNVFVKIV